MSTKSDKKDFDFYEKAASLLKDKSYKEAAKNYLNAILISRDDAKSYYGLGMCYKNTKNYAKAIKYLDKAVKIDENYFDAYFELGICHLLEGIPCGAIKNFVRAVQVNPDNPDAILQLGIAHETCEEYDMALMIYQKLIENSPEYKKAYEHKSTLLMKMNRYKDASIVLNELLTTTYAKEFQSYNTPTCLSIAPKMTHKYALKSGTTNTDNLIFGYNKDVVVGMWTGYDDNKDVSSKDSSNLKNVWVDTMEKALKDKKDNWYKTPENVVGVPIDPISGKAVSSGKAKVLYYIKGTEPTADRNLLDDAIPTIKEE